MVLAVPDLVLFALLLLCFALVYVCRKFTQALFQPIISAVGKVPYLGDAISGALVSVERSISNALGSAESGIDHLMGTAWHLTARLMDRLWNDIKAGAEIGHTIASGLEHIATAIHKLERLVHHAVSGVSAVLPRVKTLEKEYHGIEHRVKTLEKDISKGIGNDVRTSVKTIENELGGLERKVIPGIRTGLATVEGDLSELEQWLGVKVGLKWSTWAQALVISALAALGLSGLRCNSLLNSLKNRGCGLWNGLEDILGLLVDAAIFVDLCHVIPTVEALFAEFEAPLVDLVAAAANAACAEPPRGWAALSSPALSLPTTGEITATL